MGSRVVQVRVPDEIQEAASAVIKATGLTVEHETQPLAILMEKNWHQ